MIILMLYYINNTGCIYCTVGSSETGGKRKRDKDSDAEMVRLEQTENVVNPLRCPVRLYEFYLSKW